MDRARRAGALADDPKTSMLMRKQNPAATVTLMPRQIRLSFPELLSALARQHPIPDPKLSRTWPQRSPPAALGVSHSTDHRLIRFRFMSRAIPRRTAGCARHVQIGDRI